MTAAHLAEPRTEERGGPRSSWAAVSLVVGALALVAAELVHPRGAASGVEGLVLDVAERPRRWVAFSLLIMLTSLVQLSGVVAWATSARDGRGARLVRVGAVLTAAALVALFGFGMFHGVAVAIAGAPPVDPAVTAGLVRADASVPLGLTVVLALPGFHLGWAVLFAGLARRRAVPTAVGIVGAAAALGSFVAAPLGPSLETATFVILGGAIGAAGLALRSPTAPTRT